MPLYLSGAEVQVNIQGKAYTIEYQPATPVVEEPDITEDPDIVDNPESTDTNLE